MITMQFLPNQCPTSFYRFAGPETRELRARCVMYAYYSLKCSATSSEAPYIPPSRTGFTAQLVKRMRIGGLLNLYDSLLAVFEAALLPRQGVLALAATLLPAFPAPFTSLCTRTFAALLHRHYLDRTQESITR